MSTELVPLKVKIGKCAKTGHCGYPDFDSLPVVQATELTWTKWVDVFGDGWHYDKKCGHKEVDAESPAGVWMGVLLIPEAFADQAVAAFPDKCEILDESQWEHFYDDRAHCKEPEEKIDTAVLDGIKVKQELGLALTADQVAALDPNTDVPGITKNKNRRWADYKVQNDYVIKQKKVV